MRLTEFDLITTNLAFQGFVRSSLEPRPRTQGAFPPVFFTGRAKAVQKKGATSAAPSQISIEPTYPRNLRTAANPNSPNPAINEAVTGSGTVAN